MNGLMGKARPYPLMVDTRLGTSAEAMVRDIEAGEIDAACCGARSPATTPSRPSPPLTVVPLLQGDRAARAWCFRITMGVRASDQEWKRELNRLIQENQPEINKILLDYGVPLLDGSNQPITH